MLRSRGHKRSVLSSLDSVAGAVHREDSHDLAQDKGLAKEQLGSPAVPCTFFLVHGSLQTVTNP